MGVFYNFAIFDLWHTVWYVRSNGVKLFFEILAQNESDGCIEDFDFDYQVYRLIKLMKMAIKLIHVMDKMVNK